MALPQPRDNDGQDVKRSDDPRRQAVAWLNSDNVKEQVERALPNHVPFDWFLRAAQTAILNKPELARADKASLLRELVAVAQLGLVLDPQLGEAWLIVDRNDKVQRRVGYQGLRKLALQSGLVTGLNAQAVRANDPCDISLGDNPSVVHKIDVKIPDRGAVLGCYAIGKIVGTNEPQVEWMSWKDIEEHRDRYSDAGRNKKSGPWADSLGEVEMGRKTVFRRLCKWLPKSPLLADALAHEDRMDTALRDITPGRTALPAPDEQEEGRAAGEGDGETQQIEQDHQERQTEQADERPSWAPGNSKPTVQPGRAQATWLGMIEECRSLKDLATYETGIEATKIASLPAANRQAVEHAIAHQRSVLEADRAERDHPMAELDELEPQEFQRAGSQFDLIKE